MRKIVLLSIAVIFSFTAFSQDFSNKGKEFWFCFPSHVPSGAVLGRLQVWITSDQASSGTVSVTNGSFTSNFSVAANSITSVEIPYSAAHISNAESGTILQKSIKLQVTTGQPPVVAYLQQFGQARSAATLLLPTNVLGKKYYATSFFQNGTGRSQLQIIATKPNTNVVLTPKNNGVAQAPINISLPLVGDMYQYQSTQDITGSFVESVAGGSGGCSPVAVFSGSSGTSFGIQGCNTGTSVDPLLQQAYPISSWGKNFGFMPLGDYPNGNPYRIIAAEDNTILQINGTVVATLNAGEIYPNAYTANPVVLNTVSGISADKPISVSLYAQRNPCSGSGHGDPDMVILNPIEQNIRNISIFTSTQENINRQWINVLIPTVSAGSFRIDGAAPTTAFVPAANIPGYSTLTHQFNPATNLPRLLTADTGFNAICYGFEANQFESYAYSAGTNVRDLNQQLEVNNPNADPSETSSACTNSPFKFKVYFPAQDNQTPPVPILYDSMKWEVLPNGTGFIPNNFPVMVYGTVGTPPKVAIDSINIRNGKQVAWYSLSTTYTVTTPGTYTIRITVYRTSSEGCGNEQEYEFPLNVSDPPTASFTAPTPGCYLEPVVATETTPQVPKATYKWYWEFIDPAIPSTTIYTTRNATHTFTTPGVKTIRHASITTPGCLSDTIVQTVTLPQVPNGSIAGTTSVCTGAANPDITVTMVDGRAPYRFIYTINGVPQPPIVSPTGTYNISVPTGTPGTYVYELTEVRNDGSTVCVRSITGQTATVIVRPLPNAAIAGATTVCLNSAPAPVVTFTGSNATAPYTFNYTINGVAQTPIVSNAAGVATINAPTNVVGPFIYEITQVTDASSNTCTRAITATTTTIIVQDLPNAVIGSSSNAVCQNSAQPTVTFTGSVGTAPYTFNYTINGVAQTPVVSNAAGVATLNVPTGTVGTFIYEITQVQEASTQTCLRVITGQTVTVTVNPLPNAAIAGAVTVCLNATQPVVTFTGSNATAPYTFAYTINGVPQTPVVSNAAGVATVNAPTNAVGTFVYAITQITDASSTTCSRNISGTSTTIVVQDLPNAVIASSTTAVCLNSIPLPTITFTGNTGTAPYTFTYTINGVTQPTVVSNAAGVATITVPTNVATTYTYELTNVSEASGQTCARVITGQTRVVVVNPLPTATVTGAIAVCKDAPQPTVTFTGANATAPYTFNYTINGVAQPPLVSNAAGVATVLAPTNATGTFTYQLTSVRDASSTLCSQAQSGSTVITVNMLPAASYTYTIPSCANNTITFTNTTNPNAGGVTTWAWNFGDPGSGGANTSNLFSPTHTFALPGNYTVTLNAVNSNGCVSNPDAIQNIIINDTPRAGFIVPEVCINDVATVFTDTSSINAPSTVNRPLNEWNYGDPPSGPLNNSVGVNGVHLYPAPGVYTVRQIVTSNTGCRDTIYQDITINSADPVSNYDFINRTTLCSNDSVQLRNLSTVGFGNVTRLEIYWDVTGAPGVFETINVPVFNAIYKHKYLTNLQTTTTYNIRVVAYSGNVCFASRNDAITVHANPVVQFNNMPPTCLLVPPFQITQGSEVGGVPGTQSYSGPGIINAATGLFDPQVAGVGTHAIKYTFTASNPGACFDTLTKFITVIDTAHATFSYVSPTCENTPVSFTDLSTAPTGVVLANTVWNFGHGGPTGTGTYPPGATFTHVFPGVGNYTVTMHNLSAAGCLSTDTSAVITILPNHTIAGGGNSTQTVCINRPIADIVYTLGGGATNATVTGLPAGLNYTVAGGILTIFGSPTTTVGSPFNFTINTTGNACAIATSIGRITVLPDHTIVLATGNTNQSVCVNTAIEDIVYTIGGGATGVTVSGLPSGVIFAQSGNTITISGTPSTTTGSPFNFTINTTGNTCVVANIAGSIKVNPYPVPFFAPDKPVYCIPVATVKFNNGSTMPDGTGMTYAWEFDDPASGTLNNSTAISPTHFFATQRTYDVKLTATSLAVLNNGVIGCSKDIVIPLTTIKAQPKAAFSTNKPAVCIADDVIFTDESDPMGGTTITRYWDFTGSGTFISTPNPTITHLYPTIGNYAPTLYIVNSFGCHSDTLPQPFTVHPYPDFNAGIDRTVLEFGTVTLDPQVTSSGNLDYLWTPNIYFNNNNKIKRPTASLIKDDITYKLTITNEGGCSRSDDVFIKVLKFPKIPNTFTPNNDGINDKWVIEYLNSYPNCRVQVFNRTGQLVFESKGYGTPWDGTMKGKSLPFDTYYYIIEPQAGRDPVTGYVTIVK
ncbi:MAG: gliding motility-associated C-terminal domain-containing protein [Ferruginibacter sp.]|nr:gliding motility-associated C-terminal domain-containing protein [Ferruginibacter sp.]